MMAGNKLRLGVLGSGKGSNFLAIARQSAVHNAPYEVGLVLSDVSEAGILESARLCGIPAQFIPPGKYRTKLDEVAEPAYICALQKARVDLVVLAGFVRILKGEFLRAFPGKVINIHPALLPSFPGLAAWEQALEHGVKVTGCTVHFVDEGVDSGPIIAQQVVPVLDDDTPGSLHARIQEAEHQLYPAAIEASARGKVTLQGRRVVLQKP